MIPIRDSIPSRRVPVVTIALIVINTVAFLYEMTLPGAAREQLIHLYGVVPVRLFNSRWAADAGYPPGAWIGLFTSMFLHGGWFHLISNMWALWLFGDNVEDRLGHGRYLAFYVLSGIFAMLAHALLSATSAVPAVGASGAIAGVMGAYLLFYPFARMIVMVPIFFYPLFFQVPAVLFLLIWIFSQIFGGTASLLGGMSGAGGVAFWAHVGGFFAGMFLARRWGRVQRPRRTRVVYCST